DVVFGEDISPFQSTSDQQSSIFTHPVCSDMNETAINNQELLRSIPTVEVSDQNMDVAQQPILILTLVLLN
ncbi:hypothetical protein HAX54_003072, partial [Datura stramonium]|nr:hypothetical protein [Datura stramonium]